jgi:AcrR family transcriptional regulator
MPKITDTQRAARRQAFLGAALTRLATRSFRDVTIDEICLAAGASKGAFYLYFQSKQELLLALLDEQAAAFERTIAQLESSRAPTAESLRRFARNTFRLAQDPATLQLRADLWGLAATAPEVHDRLAQVNARQRDLLRGWVEQHIDTGELRLDRAYANAFASILVALSEGLVLHRSLDPSAFRWPRIQALLDVALAAIG